ncbi:MAG: Rpn family recombination-promoting nuclease/putative transposase, partial [Erysipelotrichaceae bacterium]|nr:Rpn family recombination-promoting nuclease/putative transposase [Erysipelotrichaceae bacterium]
MLKETQFYKDYMRDVYPEFRVHIDKEGTLSRYCGDLFLKHAFTKKPEILLRLCEDLSHKKIKSIRIVNTSLPVLSNTNKQLIFDFYIEDDEHCFYNLEYQNGDLTYNERVRMNLYAIRMVLDQAQRGQTYKDISRCYQGIYYMGHPLLMFKGFEDDYLKRVGSTGLPYDGEN